MQLPCCCRLPRVAFQHGTTKRCPISSRSQMGIPRPPHPRGDETSCLHLNHGLIKCASPLASSTYTGWSQIRRRRASCIVVDIRLASRGRKSMSRALRPGIGLETEFAFFLNCSDASPLGLAASERARNCKLPPFHGSGSSDRTLASSPSSIPGHISRPAGYITELEIAPTPLLLLKAELSKDRPKSPLPAAAQQLGSDLWALERSGSSCQPPRKSHMQADAPPRRSAHPAATSDTPQGRYTTTYAHTHTHMCTHAQPPTPLLPTPKHLFALLSPLLSQAFASVSLAVLPDSPVDLGVWHTNGQPRKQASRQACKHGRPLEPPPP